MPLTNGLAIWRTAATIGLVVASCVLRWSLVPQSDLSAKLPQAAMFVADVHGSVCFGRSSDAEREFFKWDVAAVGTVAEEGGGGGGGLPAVCLGNPYRGGGRPVCLGNTYG